MEEKNLLLVVSGPSGAGKGTICQALIDKNEGKINCAVSATSREVRPGEIEDQTYYYIGKEKFLRAEFRLHTPNSSTMTFESSLTDFVNSL